MLCVSVLIHSSVITHQSACRRASLTCSADAGKQRWLNHHWDISILVDCIQTYINIHTPNTVVELPQIETSFGGKQEMHITCTYKHELEKILIEFFLQIGCLRLNYLFYQMYSCIFCCFILIRPTNVIVLNVHDKAIPYLNSHSI